ncbi:hypothetical protein [Rhizobium laguerreae]|uniref:hypothetical protein n=1 Tax=Rhizobium laguerreae TaxID=1076926 RepID=UPI001441C836|nr:hypothetical protein [Rhizobium laguerreae]NKN12284.1 hypothetical protein [Rhizobium laguerreae]
MSEKTDLEYIKQVLFVVSPTLPALDDETVDQIVRGEPVAIPTSEFEVAVDFQGAVDLAKTFLPLVAASISIIKSSYDLWAAKRQDAAANELYARLQAGNAKVLEGLSEDTAKFAIRTSLYTVMKDGQRE